MDKKTREVWVVGHQNPDTDSICSAIAYAYLKGRISDGIFVPKRAGEINQETSYVLSTFGVEAPELISDVSTQVMDIEIRSTEPVRRGTTLKAAWSKMQEDNISTLPVTDEEGNLEGLITPNDIAESYMDVYDNKMLAKTRTRYRDIKGALEGEILCGNENACFTKGKVLVGSANHEIMEEYVEDDDLIIFGSRYEAQLCAIEANASALVITGGAEVSEDLIKLAEERQCVLITTPYDTFTAVRLINQSMQVKYFMRTRNLVTFGLEESIEEVQKVMSKERHRDFPVLDDDGKYVGMISRRNLLDPRRKELILVDHNEKSQAVDGIDSARILEIIDHHRIGSLETIAPVYFRNQPLGCTATIIRSMYIENGTEIPPEIAGLLCSAIISDTLLFRSPTCTPADEEAARDLAGIAGIEPEKHAKAMFRAGSDFGSKTPEEIFNQDFKVFHIGESDFGVAQISAMTDVELDEAKAKIKPYLDESLKVNNIQMVFVMLTNIMDETTYLLPAGDGAGELVEDAYSAKMAGDTYELRGVVSRKKQLIPKFISTLQR